MSKGNSKRLRMDDLGHDNIGKHSTVFKSDFILLQDNTIASVIDFRKNVKQTATQKQYIHDSADGN